MKATINNYKINQIYIKINIRMKNISYNNKFNIKIQKSKKLKKI